MRLPAANAKLGDLPGSIHRLWVSLEQFERSESIDSERIVIKWYVFEDMLDLNPLNLGSVL